MKRINFKERHFKFLIYVIVIILVNVAGISLFFRVDLTRDKKFSLSQASREVVSTLSEPLTIKAFFTKQLPAPHNNTERYLKDLLEEYSISGGRRFNYQFHNVSEVSSGMSGADENRKLARDYGIRPVEIRTVENDEIKFKKAYMGLVLIHGDMVEKIEAVTSTDGLEYKLTTAIQKLNNKVSTLLSLEEKIKVHLYLSSSLNTVAPYIGLEGLSDLPEQFRENMENLNEKHLGKIDYQYINPAGRAEQANLAEKYNLINLEWPEIEEKGLPSGTGIAGVVVKYKDETRTLPAINSVDLPFVGTTYQLIPADRLKEKIAGTMESMIGINRNIGYISDHGTPTLTPGGMGMMQRRNKSQMGVFNQLISQRYSVKNIPLKEKNIPEDLNSLIVCGPKESFSEHELFKIDQALMKGTNIAFFIDSFKQTGGGRTGGRASFEPADTGLEKLLEHYGVDVKNAYVLDENCYKQNMPQNRGGGRQSIYFIPVIKDGHINNEPGYMKNIKGLVTMQASPLELVNDNIDRNLVEPVKLLSSSDRSWLMQDRINLNPMFMHPPETKEEMSSYPLAYMLEGNFTSYFKDRDIPEKKMDEKEIQGDKEKNGGEGKLEKSPELEKVSAANRKIENGKKSRIFVIATSKMLNDQLLDKEGRTTNSTFVLNVIDHLNDQDRIAAMRSKHQRLNPLDETSALTRELVKTFNIAVLPCLVILVGFGVWIRRSLRKKQIKSEFNIHQGGEQQ
ncbi:MAG: Gldg family protein [Desulfarculaceae bacterium]|nr:Gldg family protein [Desulfarculaceae bacterium]